MVEWRNWSGSVVARPERLERPQTLEALRSLVQGARKLRVVGAGHSFMPLCDTDGVMVSLDAYGDDLEISADRKTVWAPAGWGLDRLTAALWRSGLSLINQGDINPQSLAGATATGTHGTGADLGSLSTQALAYRLMLANGDVVDCHENCLPELYQAQRLSLGLLGVALKICIHVTPAYHLEERIERRDLSEVAEGLDELSTSTRHMEFFIFPYCNQVLLKTLHPAPAETGFKPGDDVNEAVFRLACDVGAIAKPLIPFLQRTLMRLSGSSTRRVGPAYEIFPSDRSTRFEEMEYELPRANGIPALKEAIDHIRRHQMPIVFPFEFRLTAADDIWMSPFNRGAGASISMHQYAKMPWRQEFAQIEPIFQAAGGRPHWAKRHTLATADVHRLYPLTGRFLAVRHEVDPVGKFANAHLTQLFGLSAEGRP